MILDKGTAPLENGTFFTVLKENSILIEHFGTMYIYFDGYPPYSGAISENFETNINAHIQCDNEYPYSSIKDNTLKWINEKSWEIMQTCFPGANQVKKYPATKYKICTYVQNERKQANESFDLPP